MWDEWGYSLPGEIQARYWTPLTRPLSRSMTRTKSTARSTETSNWVPHSADSMGRGGEGVVGEPCTQERAKVAPRLFLRLAGDIESANMANREDPWVQQAHHASYSREVLLRRGHSLGPSTYPSG